ncbi:MAG: DUF87 domain-containing protein [Alphaproteobacteria bacterium]|nr:DUF87 domain-containing protein [Alphaproteobacteria bacterium]
MAGESKFLPQRVSDALKSLLVRMFGAVVSILGIWATFALLFYDPYLDGFGVASSFGDQSLMGHVVGMVRYAVGVIPGLFVFLCVARWGAATLIGLDSGDAPEYNFLRGFIAVCLGAAGFGLLVPSASFGGLFGAIVASDVSSLIGSWAVVLGIFCVLGFLVMGGMLLHVRWAHVRGALRMFVRWLRWIASAFHLVRIEQNAGEEPVDEDTDEGYDEEEPEEEGEEEEEKPKRGLLRKKVTKPVKAATAVAAVKVRNAGAYELPDPKFLERSNFSKCSVTNDLKQNAKNMEVHFAQYGVYGKVVGIKPGPVVTLYEFMPDDGTRMTDVNKTVTDMVRAMATENIRIAHIPRTQLIGVEMVNLNRQTVRYRGLVENPLFTESKYKIPLALGVDIGGNPMYFDLAKMPHMLIAGRTGSGKSVFVQSLITSIVYHFTPDKCKLMIIDPKGVDFGFWDDIPHLITPIVKLDPGAAVNALKWAVREMEERYKQLQLLNARNIESYNEMAAAKRASGEKLTKQVAVGTDEETGELLFETQEVDLSDMSYIVIIIDEVADLMSLARKEVESCVQRIAQKARAAGIHLIMATQRPDATTITGVIKANFPTRVSFQARSRIDSTTCLGEGGAENLLAMGDMLFSEAGRIPVRIHGAFIADDELTKIGNFLRAQGEPEYASGVTDGEDAGAAPAPSASEVRAEKNADEYERAKEIVIRDKKPTISYIQRRLGIGYNKAAGFIERMEQEGIVSAPDANNKRHIL